MKPRTDLSDINPAAAEALNAVLAKDGAEEHFDQCLQSWCVETENLIEDSDADKDAGDLGPDSELEYWRTRQSRFNSITEQLKTRDCKVVLAAANASKSRLLKKWKQLDNQITDAANEARDNVKYLSTLEKYTDPLYHGSVQAIQDGLPGLMNNVKMMHTIARYYNTTERMTRLFCKITNQMISNCKSGILDHGKLWDQPIPQLITSLENCLHLNEYYQDQYRQTKEKLMTQPKGKQFDFSENLIFNKFELFCKRVQKLKDMFSTIQQFSTLAKHNIEGMDSLIKNFFAIVEEFKRKPYDLLDYTKNQFDRDYLEFNVSIHELETALQGFINASFENIMSTEHALGMLKQFQAILQRDSLQADLDSKYMVIFHNYGLDLETVQKLYEKYKNNPPMSRNAPPVAGNIQWARQLLRRIEEPMRKFQTNKSVMATKESKKVIKTYNKVARALIEFETLWHYAWGKSVEAAKAGLQATLIIRHPENGHLYVNFDREILQLIRETKCLQRIGVDVPDSAKMVLLQEDKFKNYHNMLSFALREYERVVVRILPVIQPLLQPHMEDLERKIQPGMATLTWTSMNIDSYLDRVHDGIQKLEELVNKINDIVENRIEANLREIGKSLLVDLPADVSVSLDVFVAMQDRLVKQQSEWMDQKNYAVENAVHDLLEHAATYKLGDDDGADDRCEDPEQSKRITEHYSRLMYRAILNATKNSFMALKKRIGSAGSGGFLFIERPFFDVDVELTIPNVSMNPSLDDIQKAVNHTAILILKCSKRLLKWGQARTTPTDGEIVKTYHDMIAKDQIIVKMVLLLTGSIEGTKKQVLEYMESFRQYDWLWKNDMNAEYSAFTKTNPTIEHFEAKLKYYMSVETEIMHITPVHNIGALSLETQPLKFALKHSAANWKTRYATNLHVQAKEQLATIMEYINTTRVNLGHDINDLEDVRVVMATLKEIREKESEIDLQFGPVEEMYSLLNKYEVRVPKEEVDMVAELRYSWRKMRTQSTQVTEKLSKLQVNFKRDLVRSVKTFVGNVDTFRMEFDANGPMVEGIAPMEAVDRLKKYENLFADFKRKWDTYEGGEELFGLPLTEYPALVKTEKELAFLSKIYGLYVTVINTINGYSDVLWVDVVAQIDSMSEQVGNFQAQMKKLPRAMRELGAYEELRKTIEDFLEVLPLLQMLSNDAMRQRHWTEIQEICDATFKMDADSFKLSDLMEADLLKQAEDVEEIASAAVKELQIEVKLGTIVEQWEEMNLEFNNYKNRGPVLLQGVPDIMEAMEETQMTLGGMMSSRYVVPFKEDVSGWVMKMSTVSEILEQWVIVQNYWTYMEAVFSSGDIAKQLPAEAKRFASIDKNYMKVMTKAFETPNVVQCCCGSDLLKNLLPHLNEQLELCQKSLTGYLEAKRNIFARFYFVSDPVLLEILSQGSQPELIQQHLPTVLDSVALMEFDKKEIDLVVGFVSGEGESIVSSNAYTIKAAGNVEDWLGAVVMGMQCTIKEMTNMCAMEVMNGIGMQALCAGYCAQTALIGIQFLWTSDCEDALNRCKTEKGALPTMVKRQMGIMTELISMTTDESLTKTARKKLETMITVQVHQKDTSGELVTKKIRATDDFEWQRQCRFYWRTEVVDSVPTIEGSCVISVTDVDFECCYEYCGVKERLCITPLTDLCYVTLAQAMGMFLGGAPAGPAGTGKTETVKDLGRTLALWVVVTNCSDQMDYKACGKIFKGLSMSGAWGCFDEFNRIDLEVLSVVASQVSCVLAAMRERRKSFTFTDGQVCSLNPKCGFFITMNPGYAGRQELPENLKSQFRGVAMMVPNRQTIMVVKLAAAGYFENGILGKKFHVLYRLCEQQLSKQTHYDFGLRNILSVLRTCGTTKRAEPEKSENLLFMRTVRDMNLSKFVAQDVPLYLSLISDTFPGLKADKARYQDVEKAVAEVITEMGLQQWEPFVDKVIQLYETYNVRHGIMVVGPAGCGKTAIWHILAKSLTKLGNPVKELRMNPKAITAPQMFGKLDAATNDWTDGIFSALWRTACKEKKNEVWLMADGPVDAIWIENLNTVLDDNKLLTLANGDRIMMGQTMKMCFEPDNLLNASPATVSRAGIIWVSDNILDWYPPVQTWLDTRRPDERTILDDLFLKYGQASLDKLFKELSPVMFVPKVANMASCCKLIEALLKPSVKANKILPADHIEKIFMNCLFWSVGGMLELPDRIQFDAHMRTLTTCLPPQGDDNDLTYEFYVDMDSGEWEHWKGQIPSFTYDPSMEFSQAFVPTLDSTRYQFLIDKCTLLQNAILIVGDAGTTKTATINNYIGNRLAEDAESFQAKNINFSFQTTHNQFQLTIESVVEKRQGKTFGPAGGKSMFVFVDDLSMPEVNDWGDQPTNEIVRQLLELGLMFNLEKPGAPKEFIDLLYYAAMAQPGGGKNDLPHRLKGQFVCVNMTLPAKASIDNIFGSILRGRFTTNVFEQKTVDMALSLTDATIVFWEKIKAKMLPTPSQFHYLFNMRDLSRVFQGVMQTPNAVIKDDVFLCQLWKHECERVFRDKLTTNEDQAWVNKTLAALVRDAFGEEYGPATDTTKYFADFLREPVFDSEGICIDEHPKVYEMCPSIQMVRDMVYTKMEAFNESSKILKLDLVLFDDALGHLMRISRIIGMPRGSALLVGVGGSGKQSLTRLASFVAGNFIFQITITKTYNTTNMFEDLKVLFRKAGVAGEGVSFMMTDAEVKEEGFLEHINNLLGTGEVPGLFPKDEIEGIVGDMRPVAKKEAGKGFIDTSDNLYKFFVDRVRDNLHVCLCFSPIGEKFRNRARMFPGLFNCCSIDWFLPWPQNALADVAEKFMGRFELDATKEVKLAIIQHCAFVHMRVTEACDEYAEKFRRQVYVTPKSYLTFIEEYQSVYSVKLGDLSLLRNSLKVGLDKLLEAGEDVAGMKIELGVKEKDLEEAQRVSKALLIEIQASTAKAEKKKNECAIVADSAGVESAKAGEIKAVVETDLLAAKPALDEAEAALSAITAKDIQGLKALKSPPEIIQRIMDTVLILNMQELDPLKLQAKKPGSNPEWPGMRIADTGYEPSYKLATKMMAKSDFLDKLKSFPKEDINDETVELLDPYIESADFTVESAAKASGNMAGLCAWAKGMSTYQRVAKFVGPKMEALKEAEKALAKANKSLKGATDELAATQAELDKMQEEFDAAMAEKKRLQDDADMTKKRMDAANSLINGLSGERTRWTQQLADFALTISRLVGDVALGCAFISYCGPYNQEFRTTLLNTYFYDDCCSRGIPVTPKLDVISFLTSDAEIGEWNLEGLPTDGLSIQNGILVPRSSRWPLLIDPQGQAHKWISSREAANDLKVAQLAEKSFRNVLEECMAYGKPMLIENVEEEIDPVLDPVLLKQIIKGRTWKIVLSDKECDYAEAFTLAITTKLPNPHFTPELSAKVTVIDFTVTMGGLEDQLLGVVIQKEKPELEEQRSKLLSDVNANKKTMKQLEDDLLYRLSNSTGNLLDDAELIGVLASTKKTATEVQEKLKNAAETEKRIMETREEYRPVSIRGSVLYFLVVGMTEVNNMYNTSLGQFMQLFLKSIDSAAKAPLATKRIANVIEFMTYCVYAYIQRGLFDAHRLLFTFLATMRIAMRGGPGELPGMPGPDAWLTATEMDCILKGGAALDILSVRKKPFAWLPDNVWLNCIAASDLPGMTDLADSIYRSEQQWKSWFDLEAPEVADIPDFQERATSFQRALIIRLMRQDRTLPAVGSYVASEMGQRFVDSIPLDFMIAHEESTARTPFICLLSPGADPTQMIEDLAKKKKKKTSSISMGQGQEVIARQLIGNGVVSGDWVILQNTHLGMGYLFELEQTLVKLEDIHEDFRVFITCEPHPKFPIGLLQMSIKITNEAPAGIRAGVKRSYYWVTQDMLDAISRPEWRRVLYIMCFCHSIVQERRKFGSIGWAIPYEYNQGDLTACTLFLQNHMSQMEGKASKGGAVQLQWATVRYMVAEVQYGGRITDDLDRVLMSTYCERYFKQESMGAEFSFGAGYPTPTGAGDVDIDFWRKEVENLPTTDSPEIFGMHVNADITFRNKQTNELLDTIIDTQPKAAGGGDALSPEEVAVGIADDLLSKLPGNFDMNVVADQIKGQGGMGRPLNVVLAQEVERMNKVLAVVRNHLQDLKLAVAGTIIMGEHLAECITSLFDARPPPRWVKISWVSATSGTWFVSFMSRVEQLTKWLESGKPYSFWMTGFFNPSGFITATLQTVARGHTGWALDEVVAKTEVQRSDASDLRAPPDEGVFVHGLWLDGCGWDRKKVCMMDQAPKVLFYELPVLHISGMLEKEYKSGWGFEAANAPKIDMNFYSSPLYMYARRQTGALGTYISQINLNAGGEPPSKWCLRGVCLLLNKD